MVIQLVSPSRPSELYIFIILLFFLAAPIPSFSFTTFLHVDVDHVLSLSSVSFSPAPPINTSLPPSHLVGYLSVVVNCKRFQFNFTNVELVLYAVVIISFVWLSLPAVVLLLEWFSARNGYPRVVLLYAKFIAATNES